jgi:hypothetical protein
VFKKKKIKTGAYGVVPRVERLPSKHEAQSSNTSTAKKKKKVKFQKQNI